MAAEGDRTTLSLAVEGLEALFGVRDENLRRLETAFGVRVAARGEQLLVEGDERGRQTVTSLVEQLGLLVGRGYRLRAEDVATAVRVLASDPEASLVDFFVAEGLMASVRRLVQPRTLKQQLYVKAMLDHDMVISIGPAGTGKTYLAVAVAAAALAEKKIRRLILTRPAVEAGERLGFLPGDLAEKVNPYLRPLYDALYDIVGFEKVGRMLERGAIEVAPLAFMRGRTLNDSFIILDEAQNTTTEQMKMFLTRIGFNSKAVINGDVTQVDLPRATTSGLREAQEVLSGVDGIKFIHFDDRDVVRHPLVQKIILAYDRRDRSIEAKANGEAG
ncbi:MAG: PhoH family protein [Holophagales bacterium]|nr:MAG: PhoH family protein [Holophagales bacterium]